jgi:hypothetical protein
VQCSLAKSRANFETILLQQIAERKHKCKRI